MRSPLFTHPQLAARSGLLRVALQVNAATCLVGGFITTLAAGWIAPPLGVQEPLGIAIFGAGVMAYGGLVAYWSRQEPLRRAAGTVACVLDTLWVLASVLILLTPVLPLPDAGKWMIAGQAAWVAIVAEMQFFGLRRM